MDCIVCYAGSLIVVVIFGLLLLIANMEIEVCYEKKLFKVDCWWTRLSENYTGWGGL